LSEIFHAVSSTLGRGEFRGQLSDRVLLTDNSWLVRWQFREFAPERFEFFHGDRHRSSLVRSMEFSQRASSLLPFRFRRRSIFALGSVLDHESLSGLNAGQD